MSVPQHGDPPWLTDDQLNSWKAVVALTMTLPAGPCKDAGLDLAQLEDWVRAYVV